MAWNPQTDPLFQSDHDVELQRDTSAVRAAGPRRTPTWMIVFIALLVVGLLVGGVAGLTVWGLGLLRSSDVYVGAMTQLRENPAAVAMLGEPIEDSWLPSGSVNISGTNGNADLAIKVSGPKSAGTLYVVATLKAGLWTYETLALSANGRRIDLLKKE